MAGRGRWGEQGANEGAKEHIDSQRSTMPKTRIEPYRPPRPTVRELMEGRPAGEDDGGVPPKGCLGRPPRSAYRSEDRAEALRHVRAREIQPWRGEPAASTRSRGTTLRGRAGDRGEGRVERRDSGYMYINAG